MLKEIVVTEELQDLIDTSLTEQDKLKSYKVLVDDFIRQNYPQPEVEAIINNHLAEPEEHIAEWQELQGYRKKCKSYARELLNISQNEN